MADGTLATDIKTFACKFTGVSINYKKTTTWYNGTVMDDTKCDGVIYRKLITNGGVEYYVDTDFIDGRIYGSRFGIIGDGVVDDTSALQRLFDFISNKKLEKTAYIKGIIKITSKVVFNGVNFSTIREINFDAEIISAFVSTDEVLRFNNFYEGTISGKLRVKGNGGTSYSSRKNADGVVFNNCGRSIIESLTVDFFKKWGVRILGSSSQSKFGYIQANYCGSSTTSGMGTSNISITAYSESAGGSGSSGERSYLTTTGGIPTDLEIANNDCFVVYNNTPYTIKEINGDVLNVFPRMYRDSNAISTFPATAKIVYGGGVKITGNDSGIISIEKLDVKVGGIGIHNGSLYPASIGEAVFQFVGICHFLGSQTQSAHIGGTNTYSYYEACTIHIVIAATSTYPLNYVFLSNQGLETTKMFNQWYYREFSGNAMFLINDANFIQYANIQNISTANPYSLTIPSRVSQVNMAYIQYKGGEIKIHNPSQEEIKFGNTTRVFILSGYDNLKENAFDYSFVAGTTGTKINGSTSSLFIGKVTEITLVVAKYSVIQNEWTISWIPLINKITPSSSDSATAVGATYSQTEVQAILDELRDLKTKMRSVDLLS